VRRALDYLSREGWLGSVIGQAARWNTRKMARRFIAATTIPEAIEAVEKLRKQRLEFSVDRLGEAVLSEKEAREYQERYLQLIEVLNATVAGWAEDERLDRDQAGRIPRLNVSLKLSSLYSQFDPLDPEPTSRAVRQRLRAILSLARKHGAFINVDMEQYAYKDVTLRIFREVLEEPEFRDWSDVGIAIQAYLKDSARDLEELARWVEERGAAVWVRLVKGAYWDYETIIAQQNDWPSPVFETKAQTDANFEKLSEFLIEHHRKLRPAIASHNIRSIAHALAAARERGLAREALEFQVLYGMARPIQRALLQLGQRVRVYTPMGELLPGMAYLVRRLLENTSNESFLRAGFLEHVPEEMLLMNPVELIKPVKQKKQADEFRNEPLADFSREAARQAMSDTLAVVAKHLGESHPLVINGQRVQTEGIIESRNPSHRDQVVGRVARATQDHALRAIEAAKIAFVSWRRISADDRAALLFRAAQIMRRRRFELAAWEVHETAKQWREADADVAEAIDYCSYYGRQMLRLARPIRSDVPGEDNEYLYIPRGVTVTIAPWNFPLAILCGMTVAAVVTGNTVVMKPAEQSPVIGAKLMEMLEEAGLPPGVVNYLPGIGDQIGPVLVNHPDVATIAFTGSRAVGLEIQRQASNTPRDQQHVKRVITEMGGKNAIIIDEDADLDEAVHGVVASAFGYAGQKCSACSRAIVLDSVYDTFVNRLIEATGSLKIGPAEDPGAFVGPVIDEEARQRVLHFIEIGKTEARLAYAGDVSRLAQEGWYVAPHVFVDVPETATIAQEEIFGPVLSVMRCANLDEALRIANGTPYALTGGIYSRSPANIERIRSEFIVGNLYINRKITGALVERQPFGGFKLSGVGSKAGGPDYLQQFMQPRTITENTLRRGFAPSADAGVEGAGQ